jgi:hypothetical protein
MQFNIWLDRVAKVFAMASFIPQIDFVTFAAKVLSRAPIGESRTKFFPPKCGRSLRWHQQVCSALALHERELESPTTCLLSRPPPENAWHSWFHMVVCCKRCVQESLFSPNSYLRVC